MTQTWNIFQLIGRSFFVTIWSTLSEPAIFNCTAAPICPLWVLT